MTVTKRKKVSRRRGYTTHGFGSMKKNRGAGNRGGRGRSGSGKRGDQNKPRYWKANRLSGKFGFVSRSRSPEQKTINIKTLDDRAENLVKKGLMKEQAGSFTVNLADLGYNKLLSTGKATKKFMITVEMATEKAIAKIKEAGGDVKVLVQKNEKPKKDEKPADAPAAEPEEGAAE